ncbi:MAG: O-acetyl-ADP-ribose deacetylase [Gammaproteobacteria bacterium]|nr:O-acetyl-ADP-ribose deacetylase [Gammaproteobacteria bacterium]
MAKIKIVAGDITAAAVDAIVNAANPSLLGGGGVDGAIHRAAGPELLDACRKLPAAHGERCPVGEARLTPGFNLPARYVIHTVGPRYDIDPNPPVLLAAAYRHSLQLALAQGCRTVALPAISCGVYGYPAPQAAEIALAVCGEAEFDGLEISFYLFGAEMVDVWQAALARIGAG